MTTRMKEPHRVCPICDDGTHMTYMQLFRHLQEGHRKDEVTEKLLYLMDLMG